MLENEATKKASGKVVIAPAKRELVWLLQDRGMSERRTRWPHSRRGRPV